MPNKQGDFIWYELITPDPDAAERFYRPLLGWSVKDSGHPGMDYRILSTADASVGGLMRTPDGMGMPPAWLGYVAVDDVDAAAAGVKAAGGAVHMGPQDIPNVGRLAFVADPQGAMFYVMRGASDETSLAFASDRPREGHVAWNELMSADQAGAWTFYGGLFGWTRDGAMDMGPMGQYEFIRHGGMIGAIMPKPPQAPVSAWTYYFRVPDIDAAARQVRDGGGAILQEPIEIPGGEFSMVLTDPQGAHLGLVGKRMQGAQA
jgi:uncharacterized protein